MDESDAPRRGPNLGPAARVWLLNFGQAAAAATIFLVFLNGRGSHDPRHHVPWWLLAGLFYITERFVVHVQFRRESETFSLSEIPLVIGLFFATPAALLSAQLAG